MEAGMGGEPKVGYTSHCELIKVQKGPQSTYQAETENQL